MARTRKPLLTQQTATITSLSHEGRGIAHPAQKTVFINNALPNESVLFDYTRLHKKFDEGIATQILHASPLRAIPRCIYVERCGGCSLQHLSSEAQIAHKQQSLLEQLKHFGGVTPHEIIPPLRAEDYQYRRKARLSVRYSDKKASVLVGFHEKNGRYVADIERCEILHPSVGLLIKPLRELITGLESKREISQIEVAVSDTQTALIFRHLVPLSPADSDALTAFAQTHHIRLYLQGNHSTPLQLLWPQQTSLLLHYTLDDLIFYYHPNDFTQINMGINRQLVPLAVAWLQLTPEDNVLDLFCGLGNFSLPLAKCSRSVIGIEGDLRMVQLGQSNARANQLTNVEFFAANLQESILQSTWSQRKFHKILLDPPRSGAGEIITEVAQLNADIIVYVSCNPATLARDAGMLVQHGYRLNRVAAIDMFPHTAHVESIAQFVRIKS